MTDNNQAQDVTIQVKGVKDRLAPLNEYILKLYAVGGLPLVLVGVGAAILMLGGDGARPLAAGISLCLFGLIAWGASIYVAALRWKHEMQIAQQQDATILAVICDIARDKDSEVAKNKADVLLNTLKNLGVPWLIASAQQGAPTDAGKRRG